MLLEPGQHIQSVQAGHFQIRYDDLRKWVLLPVRECPLSIQIRQRFLPIPGDFKPDRNAGSLSAGFKSLLEKENVVFAILSQQKREPAFHTQSNFGIS
jgi:hypothetical protein